VLFETVGALEDAAERRLEKGWSNYGRAGSPTTFALEDAVASLEGGYGATAVPSGLAAIAGAMLSFVMAGDHIMVSDAVYAPTRWFCDTLPQRLGVEVTYYDPEVGASIGSLLRPNTRLVFLESPGSLTFEVQDVSAIAAAAKANETLVLLDNTWATPLYFRPFEHGVDLSIHAATKYIVGHADAMLGIIVSAEPHYRQVRRMTQLLGYAVGPDDAYLALRGLRTMAVRLARHQETALALARWLRQRPEVSEVRFPSLPGCPGHDLWRRDFSGASGLFGVVLQNYSKDAVAAMLDGLELFGMGYSWGGYESLILPVEPGKVRTATAWAAPGPVLRVHAGLEDPADLIADLEAGFERLRHAAPHAAGG
jgi:cystathionine beta-lyase